MSPVQIKGPNDPEWRDIGFVSSFEVPEIEDVEVEQETLKIPSEPTTMTFEGLSLNAELLGHYFGTPITVDRSLPPMVAVVIEHTETVSGAPAKPAKVKGWRAWWNDTNRKNLDAYNRAYRRWVAEGKPDKEVLLRTYIPRARVEMA